LYVNYIYIYRERESLHRLQRSWLKGLRFLKYFI
jgi:hypothetical protein